MFLILTRACGFTATSLACLWQNAPPGASIAMLGPEDGPKIELLYEADAPLQGQGDGISLGFEVGDLSYATKKMADHGYPLRRGPISPHPHIRFSFFSDPDGYEVQLVENLN